MRFIRNMQARSAVMRKFKSILCCDKCGAEQILIKDTRMIDGIKRRRRVCNVCGSKTTTYEISKEDLERLLIRNGG